MFSFDFKNEVTHHGIHYSRYIASWHKAGGKVYNRLFKEWLRDVQQLTDDEIDDIVEMATNGKMELEFSARKFLEN